MNKHRIAVIGAGTMGNGIAQVAALAVCEGTMVDVSTAAVEGGLRAIDATTSYQELQGAELVIEAATENLQLKLRILREIEGVVAGDG
jgi:3-hydroxybutyryl-CoA dehydrogenase